jgi:uncharacterized protein YutE (UPF0331/DUF86 family)
MRRTRLARYKEESDYIVTTIESIPGTLESDIERSAAYYKLHTSIEAAMDIIAMLLKDLGKDVGDDYANIQSLEGAKTIKPKLAERLRRCNGLRNYIVHRYNGLDEEIVLDSIKEVRRTLLAFLGVSERIINGLTKT